MSPELINSVFSGAVLLLGALATYSASRSRRAGVQRREHRAIQRRLLAALGHIFRLETDLAERGHPVPPRPTALEDPDDDGDPVLPPPPRAGPAAP